MSRELFVALQEAASICRAASAGARMRRLLAEIDLLRAAVAISAVESASDDDALELARDVRLAREAAAAMMD